MDQFLEKPKRKRTRLTIGDKKNKPITWTNSRAQLLNLFRPFEAVLDTMKDVPPEFRSSLARLRDYVQQRRGTKTKQLNILQAFRNTNTTT